MERLTEKRNGKNVIPLRNAICGLNLPYWCLDKHNEHEQFIFGDPADRLAAYEDTGLEPEEISVILSANEEMRRNEESRVRLFYGTEKGIPAERCNEILKAEQEDRLVVLPCKVGDTVFKVVGKCHPPFGTCPFDGGYGIDRCSLSGRYKKCDAYIEEIPFCVRHLNAVGEYVFLTRKDAERAMGVIRDA